METLAYLHLVEDCQSTENRTLNRSLSATAGKAAIGLTGVACTVGVLASSNAAFACHYSTSESYSPDYYAYQSEQSYQPCGCDQSQQSYYPDHSQDYGYDYAQQSYHPDHSYDSYDYGYDHSYGSYYSPAGYQSAGPNIVSPGASGPLIATLQAALADQGYYGGSIDGVYGPGTADAVAQYQIDRGLAVDGVAGGQTLASLGLAG